MSLLVLHLGSSQIFPFSNLRAFFDPKKLTKETPEQLPSPAVNVSRPYRQATDHGVILPSLDEFNSPDIFSINRDISQENHRVFPTRRIPSTTSPTVTRKKNSSRYRAQTEPPPEIYQPYQDDYETPVFITPRPTSDHNKFGSGEEALVSKVKSKSRTRSRKPVHNQETVGVVEPIPYVSEEEPLDDFSLSSSNRQPIEVAIAPDEPPLIETVPSLGVSIEEQENYEEDPGLIDYLTPPKLPSVYEKTRKRQKPRRQASHPKLKPPTPTQTLSKKDNRYRTKKHRNELKSTSVPRVERLTTAKRHISRRRPGPTRDIKKRKPSSEQLELQKQASQMDEQVRKSWLIRVKYRTFVLNMNSLDGRTIIEFTDLNSTKDKDMKKASNSENSLICHLI